MRLQVTIKVVQLVEPSFTYAALMWLLCLMHNLVLLQVGTITERLFSCMNQQMAFEIVQPSEPLLADFALKRLLSRMDAHMTIEVVHVPKHLLASFAFKRPFARVHPHVTIEVEQPTACLCAEFTPEILLSVYPLQLVR